MRENGVVSADDDIVAVQFHVQASLDAVAGQPHILARPSNAAGTEATFTQ